MQSSPSSNSDVLRIVLEFQSLYYTFTGNDGNYQNISCVNPSHAGCIHLHYVSPSSLIHSTFHTVGWVASLLTIMVFWIIRVWQNHSPCIRNQLLVQWSLRVCISFSRHTLWMLVCQTQVGLLQQQDYTLHATENGDMSCWCLTGTEEDCDQPNSPLLCSSAVWVR